MSGRIIEHNNFSSSEIPRKRESRASLYQYSEAGDLYEPEYQGAFIITYL